MKYLYVLVALIFFSGQVYSRALDTAPSYQSFQLHSQGEGGASLGIPASIVRIDSEHMAVASYLNIWIFNEKTGLLRELPKPVGVDAWYPTGLAYDSQTQELFIANYLGKDVLILNHANGTFRLKDRVQDADMVGAENVALSRDGQYFAVADFDNNGVLLFERRSKKKVWYKPFGRAHGVGFSLDGNSVVASGLHPPQVIRFDLQGNPLAREGSEGWGRNGYLWPTGVSLNPLTGELWVSDAHLGKVRSLSSALDEGTVFGMNGLGRGFFNMPYGIFHDDDGMLWVTDTFKSRIVLLDRDNRVVRTYISAPQASPDLLSCQEGRCKTKEHPFAEAATHPLGPGYQARINYANAIAYNFGLPGDETWYPGFAYSAFSRPGGTQLALAGSAPLFSSSLYYWVQGQSHEGYLIYGSPQVREWIVDVNGMACPVSLGLNYWLDNGQLRSDQHPDYPLEKLVSLCADKVASFRQRVSQGNEPLQAYAQTVLGKTGTMTMSQLASVFQSVKGQQFYREICNAASGRQRQQVSKSFLSDIKSESVIFLPELWVARVFASFEGVTAAPDTIGCVEGNH